MGWIDVVISYFGEEHALARLCNKMKIRGGIIFWETGEFLKICGAGEGSVRRGR